MSFQLVCKFTDGATDGIVCATLHLPRVAPGCGWELTTGAIFSLCVFLPDGQSCPVSSDFEFLALSFKCPAPQLECARSSSSLTFSLYSACLSYSDMRRATEAYSFLASTKQLFFVLFFYLQAWFVCSFFFFLLFASPIITKRRLNSAQDDMMGRPPSLLCIQTKKKC